MQGPQEVISILTNTIHITAENKLLDNHITWTEKICTDKAKNNPSQQSLAINKGHQMQPNPISILQMAAMWDMHLPWPFNIPCNFSDKPTTYNLTILTKYASSPSIIFH